MFEQQAATVNCYLIGTSCQESPLSAIADKGGSLQGGLCEIYFGPLAL